ncbi:anti-sigma factor [Ancylobacter vacuolatus]|uniref:Anti-sigma-K factor RskA n=1 Tax=Ancylobacter vacuolatus TaxID=223389 RepID=A0ABU0DJE4_9HYPH|nr:anti-sigma factor [Ancylobacter vacuolatus]MDQ0348537.1 anti-sigma-K factor RskA [Ancylobacter vacuolatus]
MSADERDRLASEYVLGLLDAEEMRRCEERLARDAGLAVQVELWRARLAELDATAAPVTPDPALWPRIEAALAVPAPKAARPTPARPSRLATWWESLSLWRGYGLAASAALVLLAIGTAQLARQAAQAPVLVAVLLSDQNQPAAVVNAFRDGRTELLALSALKAPEGKSLQVWTLWDRERGPVSVGLLEAMRNVELSVEGLPRPAAAQLYEVTLEPAGGSPTGRPTGPILMKGNASPTETGI